MKNKFIKTVICYIAILLLLTGTLPVLAEELRSTSDDAQSFIDSISSYKQAASGVSSIQDWINGELTNNAGSSEWYIIALSQYGDYDFSSYEIALLKYLSEHEISSASSRQKYALALIAIGSTDEYIYNTLNDSIGKQGVMSWIFGLHLLNNGYSSNDYSISSVKQKLLSLQLGDGGWAVTGSNSDVDVTAMAVQALAPYYKTDSSVETAVGRALSLLSDRQKDGGDYASYGVNNPESTSQVLIALSLLGIDAENDSRFIKNGNTLFDGIRIYELSDGSFCHKSGGSSNATATVQVFYSMVSYLRMKTGESSLYMLDLRNPSGLKMPDNITVSPSDDKISENGNTDSHTETAYDNNSDIPEDSINNSAKKDDAVKTDTDSITNETAFSYAAQTDSQPNSAEAPKTPELNDDASYSVSQSRNSSFKLWICIAIAVIACGSCVILYLRKKRNIKNFIVILGAAAVAIIIVLTNDFKTTADYYNSITTTKENAVGTVTLSIRCNTIPDKTPEHIPDDRIVLDETKIEIENGDTVYDILVNAAAKNKIHLETTGSKESVYVKGINNIYEFDFGNLSGWIYHVNGETPSVGCGEYTPCDGDIIEWLYSCELGKDL